MARKKKLTMKDFLSMVGIEIDMMADTLEVSKQTVRRWFKGSIKTTGSWHYVDADTVFDFLCTFKDGKYMEKLAEPYCKEDAEDLSNIPEIMQIMLDKLCVVMSSDGEFDATDLIERNIVNHVYSLNLIIAE